jgi:pseudouridine-5'-phosphate glycosidase
VPLTLSDEVRRAVDAGRPVVALESTMIAHGLPRPRNREVAGQLAGRLRDAGVVPALIAVVDGVPKVGVDEATLDRLVDDIEVAKLSIRDLPMAMASRRTGATTVAATAHLARRAGIRVFATGGIGGVHRDVADSFDESADLTALSRTPIAVVASGVKSILHVAATLERLETLGISVLGYRTDWFPGFYLRDSGYPVDWRVESADEAAQVLHRSEELGLSGATIVANPIPAGDQLDPVLHERALAGGLAAAQAAGIQGKALTPFLLAHMHRATEGASLEANVALALDNVRVAAEIAVCWSAR